ncbi:MAG: hypothetical protein LC676_18575 [Loktanella sp.]|nr:hypothetical protein [Loktanella sp.]
MLRIWSNAGTPLLKSTFADTFRSFRPDVPEHEFTAYSPAQIPPLPEPGGVVLVCGTKPLELLQKAGTAPKNRKVTSLRETPIPCNGGWYLITYDPALLVNEPDKKGVMCWDLRLAVRLIQTGSTAPEIGDYRWVNTFQPLIERIEAQFAKTGDPVDVAVDTETMGFYPWYPDKDIVSISFTLEHHTADVLYLGPQPAPVPLEAGVPLFDQVQWLLTSPKVKTRFANGKFDLIWIAEKWGIECANFKLDTTLLGSILDENRSNGLSMHTRLFTGLGGYDLEMEKSFDKGRMELVPPDKLLTYAGGDTDATQQVADHLKDELLADEHLALFYVTLLHPAVRAFEKVERRGVVVDKEKYQALSAELAGVVETARNKAMDLLPVKLRIKHRDKIESQLSKGKSPLTPSILKEYFFTPHGLNLKPKEKTEKTGEPSMARTHLLQFGDVPEAKAMVEVLKEMDGAAKTKSTFVDGFLKHLRPDGRLHPSYMLFHGEFEGKADDSGTVTGRLSAKDPAFQVLPKKTSWAKRIRDCYPAPKGKKVAVVDYSQGELRVVACVAGETNMLAAYKEGRDLHALTASQLASVPYDEFMGWDGHEDAKLAALFNDLRQQAKAGNFGLLYSMKAPGFQAYAWANYGLVLTLAEAETIRNEFFTLYPGLLDYHDRQRKLVHRDRQVRSPLGRIRHLPMIKSWASDIRSGAERMSINSPIQSTLSDMMIWAIALIEDAYPGGEIETVGMVHDALVAYIPEDDPALWCGRIAEVMENLPFKELGWTPQLKFPVDMEVGDTLADLKKLPKLQSIAA